MIIVMAASATSTATGTPMGRVMMADAGMADLGKGEAETGSVS